MQIAESKTRTSYPLHYNKIVKKTVVTILLWILFLVFLSLSFLPAIFITTDELGITQTKYYDILSIIFIGMFIFIITITLLSYLYQRWYFAVYFYEIFDDVLTIKKGPIAPREITIPWERVQDVYVDQDIFDRLFGLYDVHLSTATVMSGMQAHIDGVDKNAAEGLRREILDHIKNRLAKK
jgi:membrane protein YdbS with pleckstrin-like domain